MPHEIVAEYDNDSGQGVVEVVSNGEHEVCVTIGGETAYKGPYDRCETCAYLFEKVRSAQSVPEGAGKDDAGKLAELLRNLQRLPDEETLATIGRVLAPGMYSVMLLCLAPRLALPGDRSDYFAHEVVDTWGSTASLGSLIHRSRRTIAWALRRSATSGTAGRGSVWCWALRCTHLPRRR
jgi:hypothetical protein